MDEDDIIITLTLEDDSEIDCEPLCIFDVNDKSYIALAPVDEEDDSFFIYGYTEDADGNYSLKNIDSDEELDEVTIELGNILDEEFGDDEDSDDSL